MVCAQFSLNHQLDQVKMGSLAAYGYSTQSVINQILASDQWAFYQAKSTKQHLNEMQLEQMKLQLLQLLQWRCRWRVRKDY